MTVPTLDLFISRSGGGVNNGVTGAVTIRNSASDFTIPNVLAGDVYILNSNMEKIGAGGVNLDTNDIFVAQGLSNGKIKLSQKINLQGIKCVKSEPYKAPVQQVIVMGYNGAANDLETNAPNVYTVTISISTDFRVAPNRMYKRSYSFASSLAFSPTYAQKLAFVAQFATEINNDKTINTNVVALAVGDGVSLVGLRLTALSQSANFKIGDPDDFVVIDCEYFNASSVTPFYAIKTVTTAPIYGNGTYAQVANMEWKVQGHRGNTNAILFPIPDRIIYSQAGSNYNLYNLEFNNSGYGSHQSIIELPCSLIIGVETGRTGIITDIQNAITSIATGLTSVAEPDNV